MANDIKIKGSHPISENLSTITVGDQRTCLEISDRNGARVTGDLIVTGDIKGNVTDITFDDITCSTITTTGTITAGGNVDAGSNTVTAKGGLIADNITIDGTQIDLSSGSLTIDVDEDIILDNGADDEITFKEAGSTYAKIFEYSGGNLRLYESAGGTDSFTIYTTTHGATNIGTIDAAGKEADLTVDIDGFMLLQTIDYAGTAANGEDITIKAGKDVVIDKNYSHTTALTIQGLHVDLDRTGDVSTGTDTAIGINLDIDHTGASGGTIYSTGLDIDVVGDTGGTSIANGIMIDISGTDASTAIYIDNKDGGIDFKSVSSVEPLDYFSINTIEDGETTLKTFENGGGSTAHLNVDVDGDISLDAATGGFIAKNAGTEFSVANSAFAGMILGYTTVGIDAATDSYTLTTSFVVTDSSHTVQFVAPPSGVVEISVQIYGDLSRRPVYFGLSDNATYNALDVTHEHSVSIPAISNDVILHNSWVITGLTPGTTLKYYLGAKSSHVLASTLRWGGDATEEYPPFIMKAIALPTAVSNFAVYG